MMLSSAGTIVRLSGVGCVVGSGRCECRIVVTEGSIPSTSGWWWWRMIVNVGVASVVEARRYECHIAVTAQHICLVLAVRDRECLSNFPWSVRNCVAAHGLSGRVLYGSLMLPVCVKCHLECWHGQRHRRFYLRGVRRLVRSSGCWGAAGLHCAWGRAPRAAGYQ